MRKERWFPAKHKLPDGTKLGTLAHAGVDWQIYRVDRANRVLAARASLARRWTTSGLLSDSVCLPFTFGDEAFVAIASAKGNQLVPVNEGGSVESKADAMAFAISLRESRKIEKLAPLHDAIYAERLSRLLPTWSVSPKISDQELLGTWLTGGVAVSATSVRRLTSLMGWLGMVHLKEVVEAAGFSFSISGELGARSQRAGQEAPTAEQKTGVRRPAGENKGEARTLRADGSRFRLPGRPALERFFNEHVVDILSNAARYKALGIGFPAAIVLHGPPGCGKTFAVERLVEYLDWPIFYIDSNSVGSPFIHETSRKIAVVFEKAGDAAPSVVVIDEMESFLSDRQINLSAGLHHVEEVAEFLRKIPEATAKQVLVIGMTNRLEMIDSAILRRGRFDHIIEVGMPSREEVSELMTSLLKNIPVGSGLVIEPAVAALTGKPLSDAAFAVREAARLAARASKTFLDQESLEAALASLPPPSQPIARPIGFVRE